MSHFLQRLAASVVARPTAPRLRPVSGSIYAPLSGRAADVPKLPVEIPAPIVRQVSAGTVERGTRAERFEESRANEEDARSHVPGSRELQERLVPAARSVQRLLHVATDDSRQERGSKSAAPSSDREEFAESRDISRGDDPASLREVQTAGNLLRPMQPLASARDARAHVSEKPAERRAAAQTREADEITIHIGRIEVAAIAQPVARPASAPTRRAMSLDEYLKRGNGRAR